MAVPLPAVTGRAGPHVHASWLVRFGGAANLQPEKAQANNEARRGRRAGLAVDAAGEWEPIAARLAPTQRLPWRFWGTGGPLGGPTLAGRADHSNCPPKNRSGDQQEGRPHRGGKFPEPEAALAFILNVRNCQIPSVGERTAKIQNAH